ncbi:MAG: F0F1 ATP synthase subunit A [Saprospiraceae bacterium]|nr:F0F1 ATP synthase subunit A [Saprospiraceae bacterium]
MYKYLIILLSLLAVQATSFASPEDSTHTQNALHESGDHGQGACGIEQHTEFDAGSTALHHIADANVYSIGPFNLPLPCFLYVPTEGWHVFSSSKFDIGHHGTGHKAINGFVLDGGTVRRVADESFPKTEVQVDGFKHSEEDGKFVSHVCYNGQLYLTDAKSTADFGVFGGGITSFYDFSLTKNSTSLLLMTILLIWVFLSVNSAYKKRKGQAPSGLQNFIEPIFIFIQDDVCKPFLGNKWEKYLPFIMSLFFFVLVLNFYGQIPFFGGANVTGNLAFTMVLAIIAFLVTNFSGNGHYWKHILWPPGVPLYVKVILVPVEIIGVFIKPLTLMLRLFANITAGHLVILVFISLIFIFGNSGESVGASLGASIGSFLLTMFMMAIELIVAFVQAFVFAILTASYIGAATEEAHH